ncbi:hypothetical protein D1821_03680 [Phaeobacter inhibens]|uniref:Rap1a/Tai family immunity protein n=1 Tax=Phaeobacter inhibens TaxID=221822 RepID=UPI000160E955|nr:Rap1a/Tai family immunity protein [Phaeobacter inhibens]AFO86738.1 hypothetical protein PGA2_c07220 [Phaeobacter inhibens 2.10]AXT41551.1 hypothetical protein D1821_03680 [Phaeobacter inhibens]
MLRFVKVENMFLGGIELRKFVILAALFVASQGSAGAITGNDLHEICTDGGAVGNSACSFYIIGAWEGLNYGVSIPFMMANQGTSTAAVNQYRSSMFGVCGDEMVSNSQIVDVVGNYLRNTPEMRHFPARGLILNAMSQAFPCAR